MQWRRCWSCMYPCPLLRGLEHRLIFYILVMECGHMLLYSSGGIQPGPSTKSQSRVKPLGIRKNWLGRRLRRTWQTLQEKRLEMPIGARALWLIRWDELEGLYSLMQSMNPSIFARFAAPPVYLRIRRWRFDRLQVYIEYSNRVQRSLFIRTVAANLIYPYDCLASLLALWTVEYRISDCSCHSEVVSKARITRYIFSRHLGAFGARLLSSPLQ